MTWRSWRHGQRLPSRTRPTTKRTSPRRALPRLQSSRRRRRSRYAAAAARRRQAQPAGRRDPRRRGARWLAVGRVSPNKALENTVAALAVARAHQDPDATLLVVGKPATESYAAALRRFVIDLGVSDAVRFTGHASDATVASAYAQADVLVVTSEHEGFCVPVVEAMAAHIPVVAFDQGAVPEVLGGAGLLVSDKDPYALAGAIDARAGRRADAGHLGPGRQPAPR